MRGTGQIRGADELSALAPMAPGGVVASLVGSDEAPGECGTG